MNWNFEIPKEEYVEVVRNKHSGIIFGYLYDNNGIYIFKGRNKKEFEDDMIKVLSKENKNLLTRIEEKGFDKVINYFYQTLENNNEGGIKI